MRLSEKLCFLKSKLVLDFLIYKKQSFDMLKQVQNDSFYTSDSRFILKVTQKGFEPLTVRAEIWYSIQLNYWA